MSDLRALAGGVICAGFPGTQIDASLERRLTDLALAGVVLFSENIATLEQTRALTARLRGIFDAPIVAIDQEGGRVMRLREGVMPIPPMREIGASHDPELAQRTGERIGTDLRSAGINVDFAPVLDLALFERNTVIGDRSFGADPQEVTRLGAAVARGLRGSGIVPTFKHFPGHGATDVDSHFDLPVVDADEHTLRTRDLIPFAKLLPDAPTVMTAHIVVRAFDPDWPATLSPRVLTDLLRGELGFRGVCFTDCMEMNAISKSVGSAHGAVQALHAGADCVLISHRLDVAQACVDAIAGAVESGTLAIDRLQQAFDRVCSLRATLC